MSTLINNKIMLNMNHSVDQKDYEKTKINGNQSNTFISLKSISSS